MRIIVASSSLSAITTHSRVAKRYSRFSALLTMQVSPRPPTSQLRAEITPRKARQRRIVSARQCHHLEQLAHLVRLRELFHALRETKLCVVVIRGQYLGDATCEQEGALRGVTRDVQPRRIGGLGHGGEIDMSGDALQARP